MLNTETRTQPRLFLSLRRYRRVDVTNTGVEYSRWFGSDLAANQVRERFHCEPVPISLICARRAHSPPQSGALLALANERLRLDYLSRPDAFTRMYPKLLDGYLLDALDHLDGTPASEQALERFLGSAAKAPQVRSRSAGLGEDVRLAGDTLVGSGLTLEEELLQTSLFTTRRHGPP